MNVIHTVWLTSQGHSCISTDLNAAHHTVSL